MNHSALPPEPSGTGERRPEDEPLIEPQAMLESDERRRRYSGRHDSGLPLVRVALMSLALVVLLVFHASLTEGATGCFQKVANQPQSLPLKTRAEEAPPRTEPEIQIRRVGPSRKAQ